MTSTGNKGTGMLGGTDWNARVMAVACLAIAVAHLRRSVPASQHHTDQAYERGAGCRREAAAAMRRGTARLGQAPQPSTTHKVAAVVVGLLAGYVVGGALIETIDLVVSSSRATGGRLPGRQWQ
jgi:hypothetical protein